MAGHKIEEEYKGFRLVVHRIGSSGEFTSWAIRPLTGTKRLSTGEFSGQGAKKSAYEKIKEMVDAATSST
ncbi:hypothetical protein [Mangrovibacter plantisponsor]|uniref:WGR domain-containing protein n=1 Tax=Mangrovibacter plantisponsor TaxID=451513 RepID=A0A317Q7W9_9ENTR|nr:hypothetical protein [Mangrovibacter plantisponsor]PWW11810.1 hypothetical protein DES37_102425 [Mangrovibacter plantisponsor]